MTAPGPYENHRQASLLKLLAGFSIVSESSPARLPGFPADAELKNWSVADP
jgi:hypothetical protein